MEATYILAQLLPDGGPVYSETNMQHLVVEPFNAASCLLFIIMTIYWIRKLHGRYTQFPFLCFCIFLLGIGAVGGAFYHAFRSSAVFLMMDWVPISLLSLMGGGYLLYKLLLKQHYSLVVALGLLVALSVWGRASTPEASHAAININYAFTAAIIIGPTFTHLIVDHFNRWELVAYSCIAFLLAIFFRMVDLWQLLPMGTHFLWHIFGAMAAHFMLFYLYVIGNEANLEYDRMKLQVVLTQNETSLPGTSSSTE